MNKINILLPPVWSAVYLNTAKLLKFSLESCGIESQIVEVGRKNICDLAILLGWNLIPERSSINIPYILYQLEPLSLPIWQEKLRQKRRLFDEAESVWDYSDENCIYLNRLAVEATVVPLGYHKSLEEVHHDEFPEYDVLFVGFLTERRQKLLEKLQKYCSVSVQPKWGHDFTTILGRSKILLNIHQYDVPTPLEQPRIFYGLNNDAFIVSEASIDSPYNSLVTEEYNELVACTLGYLNDFDKRELERRNIVNWFKKKPMSKIVATSLGYAYNL